MLGTRDSVLDVMEGMAAAIGFAAISQDMGIITGEVGSMTGALFKL